MLESLIIKDTAIIDNLTVNFEPGMNCMTGETGAGKSIIIDSLCCLLGERVSRETIRNGASEARITGIFKVSDSPEFREIMDEIGVTPEDDGTLILSRQYSESKSTCRVNGNVVTLSSLRKLGELLVDVHGQHDNHALLSSSTHVKLLDSYAGEGVFDLKQQIRAKLGELQTVKQELDEISGDPKKRAQLQDLLEYQVNEIYNAHLKPGEDDELDKKQALIDNAEKISNALGSADRLLSGSGFGEGSSASDLIGKAEYYISAIEKYGEKYSDILTKIRDAKFALEDACESIKDAEEDIRFDPDEAKKTADRIDVLYELKRKYGSTIDEVIAFGDDANDKLEKLQKSEELADALQTRKKQIISELLVLSDEIHKLREIASEKLEESVVRNLCDMEMAKVKFGVSNIKRNPGEDGEGFNFNGLDEVEFLISTNPGESLKPLGKIASGGELSRIMLAIKSVLADVDNIPVLVFDEIDTGISGIAAGKVAEKFKAISKNHQLICVSHLAQIAAIADNNIVVSKSFTESGAISAVSNPKGEDKITEIARLLDGDVNSAVAREHAKELIARFNR